MINSSNESLWSLLILSWKNFFETTSGSELSSILEFPLSRKFYATMLILGSFVQKWSTDHFCFLQFSSICSSFRVRFKKFSKKKIWKFKSTITRNRKWIREKISTHRDSQKLSLLIRISFKYQRVPQRDLIEISWGDFDGRPRTTSPTIWSLTTPTL